MLFKIHFREVVDQINIENAEDAMFRILNKDPLKRLVGNVQMRMSLFQKIVYYTCASHGY